MPRDEDRVFDVTRPSRVSPSATSKPVIVGHHPMMPDPMMKTADEPVDKPSAMRIPILDKTEESQVQAPLMGGDTPPLTGAPPQASDFGASEPHHYGQNSVGSNATDSAPAAIWQSEPSSQAAEHHSFDPQPHPDDLPPATEKHFTPPGPHAPEPMSHVEGLHIGPPKQGKKKTPWIILIVLVVLIGIYLAIDDGKIGSGINLPIHVFKQKTTSSTTTPPASPAVAKSPSLPSGFTKYNLTQTPISFDAPSTWGQPTSAADPGYSARGGTNKSDGTYAYIVTFASNKDVQIAVTSSKYLPTARDTLYYDFLQWCVGTNDGKYYLTTMHYSTTNKIDTPTTTSCDQGPLTDATKLDSSTIVELKVLNTSGNVIGDIYTKNLNNANLPVLRVKDAAMTNGDNIKQLLGTIQIAQ